MFKKSMAIILSILLLMSAFPAFAATVTDSTTGLVTYTDDFNSAATGSYSSAAYPSGTLTSDVFATVSTGGGYDIVAGAGRDGSNALKLRQGSTTGGGDSLVMTQAVDLTGTNNVMELTYELCIANNSTYTDYNETDSRMYIDFLGSGKTNPLFSLGKENDVWKFKERIYSKYLYAYTEDTWYKVNIRWTTSGREAYITDSTGTVVASIKDSRAPSASTQITLARIPGRCIGTEILIDNAVLKVYSDKSVAPSITSSSITDGETGVFSITNRISVSFDQPINTSESTVTLKAGGETLETCTIAQDTTKLYTYNISWKTALSAQTTYTLDFSGVKNSGGASKSSTISFETIEAEAAEPVTYKGAQTVSGAALSAVPTDDSIKLTFDSEILLPDAGTDVSLYKTEDHTKTPVSVGIELSDDAKSITVTPSSALSLDTNYTIDFSGVLSTLAGKLEGTSSVSFTTVASRDMIYLSDNLEDATTGASTTYSSDILTNTTMYINIANGAGFEGGKGLIWDNSSNPNSTVKVMTQPYALDEKETLFFEYKMRLNDIAINEDGQTQAAYFCVTDGTSTDISSSTTMFKIFKTSDGYVLTNRTQSSEKRLVWDRDTWYTVIYKVGRNAQTAYLMDEDGNVVLESSYTDARKDTVRFVGASIKSSKTYINMNMDDFKVYRVQEDMLAFDKKLTNIADGAENVGILSKFTFTFNQPLGEGAQRVFSLYEGDTQVSAEIKRVGGNEIRIAPATAMKPGRNYTIKVDGITALSGNAYGEKTEIGFTTMKIYDVNAISSDVEISEDGALSSGTKKLVVDNTSEALTDVVVVAAVYADSRLSTLIGWESVEFEKLSEGETEIPLVFKNSYSGVGSVKFMMFSSFDSMKPLMKNFSVSK